MEGKNTQRSISAFEIPVNEYEIDMEEELAKEKKNEILDLFNNHNQLKSKAEFEKIRQKLHFACKEGDLELIKILLGEMIQNDSKDLTFKIDKTNQTASLFRVKRNLDTFIIPRTVKYEMNDYLVTSITSLGGSRMTKLNIKSIKFDENSSVSTIYKHAFSYSTIEEIYFPKSLIELKEKWCFNTKLNKFIISTSNDQFIFKDNKYLLGKSDQNKDEFDILLFVRRDIKEISIPSNIKIIGSNSFSNLKIEEISIPSNVTKICEYAFSNCCKLKKIKFSPNSNLQTIEGYAFSYSDIEEISIPSSVTKICESALSRCFNLRKVEIPTNSNLQTIEGYAFSDSKIEEIYFPKSLIELKEKWCFNLMKLTNIIISPSNDQFIFNDNKYLLGKSDRNNDEFDNLLFVRRDIEEISIPSNIKIIGSFSFTESIIKEIFIPSSVTKICEFAFSDCSNLRKVEIQTNSNLQTIERNAFFNSKIEEISIPSNVTKICEHTFSSCSNLRKVEISTNSNLQTIEEYAFSDSTIEEIYFPKSMIELKEGWCENTKQLNKIIISPSNDQFIFNDNKYLLGKSDQNKDEFDILLFARRDIKRISIPSNIKIIGSYSFEKSSIKEISIPSSVTKICEYAFSECSKIIKIEIPTNSNLQTIERYAFFNSKIEEISIPSSVTIICEHTFSRCSNLRKVEIPTNSNLQTIGQNAFYYSKIKGFYIPSNVTKICEYAFSNCKLLQIIEISEQSKLYSIPKSAFEVCPKLIIMIPPTLKELVETINST